MEEPTEELPEPVGLLSLPESVLHEVVRWASAHAPSLAALRLTCKACKVFTDEHGGCDRGALALVASVVNDVRAGAGTQQPWGVKRAEQPSDLAIGAQTLLRVPEMP